jgi:hypothetical protein
MRVSSRKGLVGLGVAFIALGAASAEAKDDMKLENGTYARVFDWCVANRADQNSPIYKEKRAFINLSESEINWDQSVGKITNVVVDRNKINLTLEMTEEGTTKPKTLTLTRKNKKTFVLIGVNFYHCGTYQPNPSLGR